MQVLMRAGGADDALQYASVAVAPKILGCYVTKFAFHLTRTWIS